MARSTFGGTHQDLVLDTSGPWLKLADGRLTFWDSPTGGTRYTNLLLDGAPVAAVDSVKGQVPAFEGPDGVIEMWADDGDAVRHRMLATDTATIALAKDDAVAAKNDAEAAAASVAREQAGGVAGLDASGKLFETRLPDRLAGMHRRDYDVREYGTFDPTATAATNAATMQAAQDAAAAAGGGRVVAPPGVYDCVGVIQDSHVWFDLPGVTLRHPTGDGGHIIDARIRTTTGTIAAGSDALTVADATGIEVGSIIGIRGASGQHPLQSTTIVNAVDATQTTGIVLNVTTGFPNTGGFLVTEGEIIGYTGITTGELTGVTRAMYGTTGAAHAAGVVIAFTWALLTEVLAVGATITLADKATSAVTSAPVSIGTVRPRVTGVHFDGNRPVGGPPGGTTLPVNAAMVRWGIYDYTAERCGSALYLDRGTRDTEYNINAHDCSVPESDRGSVAVFFRRANRNKGRIAITGEVWLGVLVDNRTTLATEWDGPCNENEGLVHIRAVVYTPWKTNLGLTITGSNRNKFDLVCSGVRTGFTLVNTEQAHTFDGSVPTTRGNVVNFLGHTMYQPWLLDAPDNIVSGWYSAEAPGGNSAGNLILGGSPASTAAPVIQVPDGTTAAPSLGFAQETGTGFYRITTGSVQFVSQGALGVRFTPTGLLMRDNSAIAVFEPGSTNGTRFGSGATAKLGFWGATPVVRPVLNYSRIGETTAEAQLRAALAAAGLVTDSTTA